MQAAAIRKDVRSKANSAAQMSKNEAPRPFSWTVDDYYLLAENGFFDDKRVELIKGQIIEMAPMGSPNATAVRRLLNALNKVFGRGFLVNSQLPLRLGKASEPEPDVSVVEGSIDDYVDSHPRTAKLVIEVSDTTIKFDQTEKARLYAEHDIEEYWLVNLRGRCVEVYRRPSNDKALGFYYAERTVFGETGTVSPIAKPKAKIKVADILP